MTVGGGFLSIYTRPEVSIFVVLTPCYQSQDDVSLARIALTFCAIDPLIVHLVADPFSSSQLPPDSPSFTTGSLLDALMGPPLPPPSRPLGALQQPRPPPPRTTSPGIRAYAVLDAPPPPRRGVPSAASLTVSSSRSTDDPFVAPADPVAPRHARCSVGSAGAKTTEPLATAIEGEDQSERTLVLRHPRRVFKLLAPSVDAAGRWLSIVRVCRRVICCIICIFVMCLSDGDVALHSNLAAPFTTCRRTFDTQQPHFLPSLAHLPNHFPHRLRRQPPRRHRCPAARCRLHRCAPPPRKPSQRARFQLHPQAPPTIWQAPHLRVSSAWCARAASLWPVRPDGMMAWVVVNFARHWRRHRMHRTAPFGTHSNIPAPMRASLSRRSGTQPLPSGSSSARVLHFLCCARPLYRASLVLLLPSFASSLSSQRPFHSPFLRRHRPHLLFSTRTRSPLRRPASPSSFPWRLPHVAPQPSPPLPTVGLPTH